MKNNKELLNKKEASQHVEGGKGLDVAVTIPYEPWKKEDIEKFFEKIVFGVHR